MQLGKLDTRPRTPRKALHITYNGRNYAYRGREYANFLDAVNDARRNLSAAQPPTEVEQDVMRRLGITYSDGVFYWREHRYDRLAEASAHARLNSSR